MYPRAGADLVSDIAGQGAEQILLHRSIQRDVEVLGSLLHVPHLEKHPYAVELPRD